MNTERTDMNKIDIIKPTPGKACEHFDLTCSYCRQDTPHSSPIHSASSSEDWNGNKAKAKEQKSLIDFEVPKQKTNMEQITGIDEVPFHKLNLGQNEQKEKEPLEMMQSFSPTAIRPNKCRSYCQRQNRGRWTDGHGNQTPKGSRKVQDVQQNL